MATSGSIDFALNCREICTYALEELRIIGAGETPTDDDLGAVRRRLNMMLKSWAVAGPNLWRSTDGTATLVSSQASYVLSPRPFRVLGARYRSSSGVDLPMEELTADEYADLPLKTSTGVPTTYWVDYQRTAATMYVWPVPTGVTTETIRYDYQRMFEDLDSLDNDLDVPAECLELVGTSLAVRCFALFGKKDDELQRRSLQLMAEFGNADREQIVRFVPDRR